MKLVNEKKSCLITKSAEVPYREDVEELINSMWSIMIGKGIGLSANQIGVSKRIILIRISGIHETIINPKITKRSVTRKNQHETCLSFPGRRIKTKRCKCITIEGFNRDWEPIRLKLKGAAAICAQHELDHLNGITIVSKRRR